MKTLGKILTGGAIILESLFAGEAYSQNTGWLARTEVKQGQNSFIYQPNIKWQNVDRRAQTQFYLGANVDESSVQSTQFSINPLIRRGNLDGAVAFFGELNQNSENRYGLETGFNIDDVNFYLGHSREQNSNMTAGKIGKRFGKQKVELGTSYTTGETDNQRFYAFLRTTLKDALEANSRFDFSHNGLEKAMLVAQLNASGDGFIPGARYVGTFTPEQDKHSFRIGFGKNRKFSYGSVDGATDFYFIPLNMINPAFLNYGNGTLPHGYGEYVINGAFVNSLPEVGKDRFVADLYKNFYNVYGIDNPHIVFGFDREGGKTGYSAGVGFQEGTLFGSLRFRFTSNGHPEFFLRLDKALGIPKNKFLLEL